MDAKHSEGEANLKGTELSRSNQRVPLDTYIGNRKACRN
jgi:hypothetical protein